MPSFSHETTLEFTYDSDAVARIVERSVAQEVGEIEGDRSTTTLSRTGDTVTVVVEAADLVALRAGVNTWIRLVEVAETVHDCGVAASS
ncbi:KEOPS complex subunit Pcc1 [Haloarchaeobius amylolyticus]|uniref:KEOPS complex subunit Pcc1 n=1 Tax=Haloarchaeobius amylolyticus TaxID=1198296 RepID=UPI002271B8EE|nr:KEOPS complex subunit Pcc1 [Haloarchaeobius amylolyticus]